MVDAEHPDCAVIVFAKAPFPGFAKTRLAPALGGDGAARLAQQLLARAVLAAAGAGVGPVELCCAPDSLHPSFAALAERYGIELTLQGDGDLGARMNRAFERVLARAPMALLIGTDAPALDAVYLEEAAAALHETDAVVGPALDGGYALIGLKRAAPGLFDAMPWSTPDVLDETRRRLRQLSLHHTELAPLADIDEPADLIHLPTGWAIE
ncbi:MAG: TIGR04282 family arsenosugar biosynthesis glycosyltransferase [Burkholderiaceae bacterium]